MKKYLLIVLFIYIASYNSFAQLGVDYHQSNIPFIGLTYDIKNRFLAELRVSTDIDVENLSPELILAYKTARNENFNFYTGLGARANVLTGLVVPIGFAMYPFDNKQFGFHIETAPILSVEGESSDVVLRGSWGIRYRFK